MAVYRVTAKLERILELSDFQVALGSAARLSVARRSAAGFMTAVRFEECATRGEFVLNPPESGAGTDLRRTPAGYGISDGYTDILGVNVRGRACDFSCLPTGADFRFINDVRRNSQKNDAVRLNYVELIGVVGERIELMALQEAGSLPIQPSDLDLFVCEHERLLSEYLQDELPQSAVIRHIEASRLYSWKLLYASETGNITLPERKKLLGFDGEIFVDKERLDSLRDAWK